MEYLEVLAEDKTRCGMIAERSVIHKKGYYHSAVIIFILDQYQNILIQKRSIMKDSNPGKWDVSCAGHVMIGECYSDAAKRELSEELGIGVSGDKLIEIGDVNICYERIFHDETFLENEYDRIFVLHIENSVKFILQNEEVDEIKWVSFSELKELQKTETCCVYDNVFSRLSEYFMTRQEQ